MRHWISGLLLSTTVCVGMTVKNLEFETRCDSTEVSYETLNSGVCST